MTARAVLLALVAGLVALAAPPSPVGVWKTYDDKTGELHGLVQITETAGGLTGRILKSYDPKKPDPRCDQCDGERKGQPVIGMVFLWGLQRDGDEYRGGYILDPDNGRVYRAKLRLADQGRRLQVRGFIGFSLLGRTQTWTRDEQEPPVTSRR